MDALIIAAGLGKRLRPYTNTIPKCLLRVNDKSIIENQIKIFKNLGIKKIFIITGYQSNKIKNRVKNKDIIFIKNSDFKKNNILESLFYAKKYFNRNLLISYSDIIFEQSIVKKLLDCKNDISLLTDINWKKNYINRSLHPISQAENVYFSKNHEILKIGKNLLEGESNGEFIGMLKLSINGSKFFLKYYNIAKKMFKNNRFYNSANIKNAYITDFITFLIEHNIRIKSVPIKNKWLEIDTVQDYKKAKNFYK